MAFFIYICKMNKQLLDYIQELSKRDKKNLSQKVSKVFEEGGELAKKALPFDSAYACRHRFVDKHNILEEVVDTMLAAISIAYDLGFSHEDIEEVMEEKAQMWQGLQVKEEAANFPIPYEIHVTVEKDSEKSTEDFMALFSKACAGMNVKPIILDLENSEGDVMNDVMTSSVHHGDNRTVYEELQRISGNLKRLGYKVLREKIESAPWHPGAPVKEGENMPKGCYFESHISVEFDNSEESRAELSAAARRVNGHLSKNVFKKIDEGRYIVMITIRDYHVGRIEFEGKISTAVQHLKEGGWSMPKKPIIEFATYDTKINHDYLWLK